ncbi:MAG: RagB/SusD family nutrient uptake outer membrane protein [Bacteroidales bacterium]|nr:MAG: RagB/SusD family nutrient uptake outer membrane protein [Bacteroidales bacterium]
MVDEYDTLDVRLATAVARPGDSILVWRNNEETWFPIEFGLSPTGYYSRKFEASPEQFWADRLDWSKGPVNVRLIRLADVYLFAAEAAFRSNDPAKALEYVNTVRERARMCGGEGSTVPAALAGPITFDDIIKERRMELACEGHRFWDLVRWRMAEQELDGQQLAFNITTIYESPKNDFYPIPASEVDYMNGVLEQYEGW